VDLEDGSLELPQDVLRARMRAAMGLAGVASFKALEIRMGKAFSAGTLKSLGAARDLKVRHAQAIARVCEVPYEWFTVPSLREAVSREAARLKPPATRFADAATDAGQRLDEKPPKPERGLGDSDEAGGGS